MRFNFRKMITSNDLKTILLSGGDLNKIHLYCETNFSRGRYSADTIKANWINTEKKLSPNFYRDCGRVGVE